MKVSGEMTRQMGKESTSTAMEPFMKETGKMTSSMVTELNYGQTMPGLKANMSTAQSMDRVTSYGAMELTTWESLKKTIFVGLEPTSGETGALIKVSGLQIKCMELALSNGAMAEYTKALSDLIRKKVME